MRTALSALSGGANPGRASEWFYPADPPTVEESVTVLRRGDGVHGRQLRGLIVVLWRAGLRIH